MTTLINRTAEPQIPIQVVVRPYLDSPFISIRLGEIIGQTTVLLDLDAGATLATRILDAICTYNGDDGETVEVFTGVATESPSLLCDHCHQPVIVFHGEYRHHDPYEAANHPDPGWYGCSRMTRNHNYTTTATVNGSDRVDDETLATLTVDQVI